MSKSETIAKDVLDRFQSVQKSVERRWKRLQISAPDLQDIATPVLFPLSEYERKLHIEKQNMIYKVVSGLEEKGRLLSEQLTDVKKSQKEDCIRFEKLQKKYLEIIKQTSDEVEQYRVDKTMSYHLQSSLERLENEKEALLEGLDVSRRELELKAGEFQQSQLEIIAAWKTDLRENEELRRELEFERQQVLQLSSKLQGAEKTIADLLVRLEAQAFHKSDTRPDADSLSLSEAEQGSSGSIALRRQTLSREQDRKPDVDLATADELQVIASGGPWEEEYAAPKAAPRRRAHLQRLRSPTRRGLSSSSSSPSPPPPRRAAPPREMLAAASHHGARGLSHERGPPKRRETSRARSSKPVSPPGPSWSPGLLSRAAAASRPRGMSRGSSHSRASVSDSDSGSPPPAWQAEGVPSVAPVGSRAFPPAAPRRSAATPALSRVRTGPPGPESPSDSSRWWRSRAGLGAATDRAAAVADPPGSGSGREPHDRPAGPSASSSSSPSPGRPCRAARDSAARRRRRVARDWERIRRVGPAARAGVGGSGGRGR
jgi:hypothetical protein